MRAARLEPREPKVHRGQGCKDTVSGQGRTRLSWEQPSHLGARFQLRHERKTGLRVCPTSEFSGGHGSGLGREGLDARGEAMVLREEPFRGALELPNKTVGNVRRRRTREGEPDARLCPEAQAQLGRRRPLPRRRGLSLAGD